MWNDVLSRSRFDSNSNRIYIESFIRICIIQMYIMERFENYGTMEDKDVYRHFDDGDYSIEHIMPQHLTPAWAEALGSDYERIHETWLHRMANLTLTAYNSKYSNNSFLEKRDMANGFKDSGIRMNQWIGSQNQWTEAELELRNDYVQQRALALYFVLFIDSIQSTISFTVCPWSFNQMIKLFIRPCGIFSPS